VLLAEQRGALLGLIVLRWLPPLGAEVGEPAATAWVERVYVDPGSAVDGVAEALQEAARAEAEARGIEIVRGLDDLEAGRTEPQPSPVPRVTAPPSGVPILVPTALLKEPPGVMVRDRQVQGRYHLADGVSLLREIEADGPSVTTLWSGAQALRTRWRGDRLGVAWSRDECLGSEDEGGDVLRFDPQTLRVRESYFVRPATARIDPVLWEATLRAPLLGGTLSLDAAAADRAFVMPPTAEVLFDPALHCVAALTADFLAQRVVADEGPDAVAPLEAVALSAVVSMLFSAGRYVGWRALEPVDAARPMGWPEVRDRGPIDPAQRPALVALLYAWMTVDAQGPLRPDEVDDPALLAPMEAVREQARALAALVLDPSDPLPGVARDIAADVHWRWGFFRLGE